MIHPKDEEAARTWYASNPAPVRACPEMFVVDAMAIFAAGRVQMRTEMEAKRPPVVRARDLPEIVLSDEGRRDQWLSEWKEKNEDRIVTMGLHCFRQLAHDAMKAEAAYQRESRED